MSLRLVIAALAVLNVAGAPAMAQSDSRHNLRLTSQEQAQFRSSLLAPVTILSQVAAPAHAQDVRFERVADGAYAPIGDLGGRRAANQGLNANIGLVLTPVGAVLIDSGATARSARRIHEAVRQVTALPVKWVINTGGQDHRWLGNGYFKGQGAQLIAPAQATAQADTRDYLVAMRTHMRKAVDDGQDISAAVEDFGARPWLRLLNAADLMPGNASRTDRELERESGNSMPRKLDIPALMSIMSRSSDRPYRGPGH